jgi:hypothetical protein
MLGVRDPRGDRVRVERAMDPLPCLERPRETAAYGRFLRLRQELPQTRKPPSVSRARPAPNWVSAPVEGVEALPPRTAPESLTEDELSDDDAEVVLPGASPPAPAAEVVEAAELVLLDVPGASELVVDAVDVVEPVELVALDVLGESELVVDAVSVVESVELDVLAVSELLVDAVESVELVVLDVVGESELVDDAVEVVEPVESVVLDVSELAVDVVGVVESVELDVPAVAELVELELVVGVVDDVVELVEVSIPRKRADSDAACDSWVPPWLKKMSFLSFCRVSWGAAVLNCTS